jgi:hypothetical protein
MFPYGSNGHGKILTLGIVGISWCLTLSSATDRYVSMQPSSSAGACNPYRLSALFECGGGGG